MSILKFALSVIAAAFDFALRALKLNDSPKKGVLTMSLILQDDQKVGLSIAPKDSAGNAARLDGVPLWESTDPAVVSVTPSSDGLSAVVTAAGPLGFAQISVKADADLDVGEERELVGTLDIEVVAGEAVSLGVVAGVPELK